MLPKQLEWLTGRPEIRITCSIVGMLILSNCFTGLLNNWENETKIQEDKLFEIESVEGVAKSNDQRLFIRLAGFIPSGEPVRLAAFIHLQGKQEGSSSAVAAAEPITPIVLPEMTALTGEKTYITTIPDKHLPLFGPDILINLADTKLSIKGPLNIYGSQEHCINRIDYHEAWDSLLIVYCSGKVGTIDFFSKEGPQLTCCIPSYNVPRDAARASYLPHSLERGILVHILDSDYPLTFIHVSHSIHLPRGKRIIYAPILTHQIRYLKAPTTLISALRPLALIVDIVTLPIVVPLALALYYIEAYS